MLLPELVTGLALGSCYSLLAVAVVLVFSGTRTLSIALGEIGAFALYAGLHWSTSGLPLVGWHLSTFEAALVAVVGGGVQGLLTERFVMRPLVGRPAIDALVATLAVALLLALLELKLYGVQSTDAPSPVGTGTVRVAGATINAAEASAFVLAVAVSVGLSLFLQRTKFGLATRAAVSDPTVARLLGVKVNSVYMFVWGVGGALSGAAASLLGPIVGTLTPFGLTKFLLSALAGAVIGGLSSLRGAVLGSLLVGLIEGVVAPRFQPAISSLCVLVAVVLVLLLRGSLVMARVGSWVRREAPRAG
ncbi:MAG: branched-chain amino acid ABC transporter permease [Actinomycetota bacterium]|nr:branched-chain amino acid ABC transporter permease [Actinomycetota bacterium]